MIRVFTRLLCVALFAVGSSSVLEAQGGPPPHVRTTMQAIERMLDSKSDSLISALVSERFTPAYRAKEGAAAHVARIKALRAKLGGMFAGIGIEHDDEGFVVSVNGAVELRLRVVLDEKGFIDKLVEIPSGDDAIVGPLASRARVLPCA